MALLTTFKGALTWRKLVFLLLGLPSKVAENILNRVDLLSQLLVVI